MDKTIVSLMCENIEKQFVDVNKMVLDNTEKAIQFIHGEYLKAEDQLRQKTQS